MFSLIVPVVLFLQVVQLLSGCLQGYAFEAEQRQDVACPVLPVIHVHFDGVLVCAFLAWSSAACLASFQRVWFLAV